MQVRQYTDEDYDTVMGWRVEHGKPAISKDFLPSIGCIVDGVAAAWLIQTDANIGILEHGISNPKANNRDVHDALRLLIISLTEITKKLELKQLWGIVDNRGISSAYEEFGFNTQGKFNVYVRSI